MKLPLLLAAMLRVTAPADDDPVRRAEAAFAAEDYEEAARAAADAHALHGDPVFLYAQAQAERLAGDCTAAARHYRAFLDEVPPGPGADAAYEYLEVCEQALAEEAGGDAAAGAVPAIEPSMAEPTAGPEGDLAVLETTPDEPSRHRPPVRDPWGWALVGVGTVGLAAGTGLLVTSRADAREAGRADDVFAYGERIDRAYLLSRASIPVFSIGGALVIAGVVRFAVLARRRGRSAPERLGLGRGGLVLRW